MIIAPDKEVIGLDNREMHLINITIFIANAYAFIQIKRSVKGEYKKLFANFTIRCKVLAGEVKFSKKFNKFEILIIDFN